MAWELLPVDYTDAIWSGLKKYVEVHNEDDTISFQDVTKYSDREKSFFGARDANRMNEALNTIMSMVENGTDLYEAFQNYFETQKAFFESQSDEKLLEFIKYLAELKAQSDKTIDEIKDDYQTEMNRYETEQQKLFQMWFDTIRGLLSNDATANLAAAIIDLETTLSAETAARTVQLSNHSADTSHIRTLVHSAAGNVHKLSGDIPTSGILSIRFNAVADYAEGDKFTINENIYAAKPTGEEQALPDKLFVAGDIVTAEVDVNNKKLVFKGGGGGEGKMIQHFKLPISDVYDNSKPQGEWEQVIKQSEELYSAYQLGCADNERRVIYSLCSFSSKILKFQVYHVDTNTSDYFEIPFNGTVALTSRLFMYNSDLYIAIPSSSGFTIFKININSLTMTSILYHIVTVVNSTVTSFSAKYINCIIGNHDYLYVLVTGSYKETSTSNTIDCIWKCSIHLPTKTVTAAGTLGGFNSRNLNYGIFGGYTDDEACYLVTQYNDIRSNSNLKYPMVFYKILLQEPTNWRQYSFADFPRVQHSGVVTFNTANIISIGNLAVYFEPNSSSLLNGNAIINFKESLVTPNALPPIPGEGGYNEFGGIFVGDAIYGLKKNGNDYETNGLYKLTMTHTPPEERPRVLKLFRGDKFNSIYGEIPMLGLSSTGQPEFTITKELQTAGRDYEIHLGQYTLKNPNETIVVEKK